MKVLILGVDGLLGQNIYISCKNKNIDVLGTTRATNDVENDLYESFFNKNEILYGIDFNEKKTLKEIENVIINNNISVVINCIKDTSGKTQSISDLNVKLPTFLDQLGTYIISFSSDSVISKNENDYIKSKKQLESIQLKNTLLIRTTFWGFDFLSNRGLINKLIEPTNIKLFGYSNYIFSGLYVGLLSNIILNTIKEKKVGLVSVFCNQSISKLDLLLLINKRFNLNKIIVEKELEEPIDYSLKSEISSQNTYHEQIDMLYEDFKKYQVKSITLCRQCHSSRIKEVFDFGVMPLAGNFLKKEDLSNDIKHTMSLSFCEKCKTLQINESLDPAILFKDYRYASSTIEALKLHYINYAKDLRESFPAYKKILEIGCNDGVFLTPLKKIGFNVLGVEPATNIANKATALGHNIVNDFFSTKTSQSITEQYGKFDIITANNVLAHIESISDVFDAIKNSLSERGFLIFEVQYLKELIDKFQYDFIYHEHIFYYSITSINNILKARNMKIVQVKENNMHGGTVRIYATHCDNYHKPNNYINNLNEYILSEEISGIATFKGIENFFRKVIQHKKETMLFLNKIKENKKTIACYGASGRSVTYANYCGIDQSYISYFIDDSPERSGRYIPGLQIPIITLDQLKNNKKLPDYIIITAWTFKTDIINKLKWYQKNGGIIIIPFPNIRFEDSPVL